MIIHHTSALRSLETTWRRAGERIAFVPTMGNLHDGHLALVKQAKQAADRVVVSIFVNPMQFGPTEDFARYPRTMETDASQLALLNVDAIFVPDINEIYPNGEMPLTRVIVPGLSDDLCGVTRPQLYYGVTTVVTKLFHIVQPDMAVFGEKDIQQVVIIRRMVQDLNFSIEILSGDIVREADGLAMSSRNQYLSIQERKTASTLYATLCAVRDQIKAGSADYEKLSETAIKNLLNEGFDKVDYLTVRDKKTLSAPVEKNELVILAAAFLGKTRLIDNVGFSI
jgi:pantoate--beta-alanine ligase